MRVNKRRTGHQVGQWRKTSRNCGTNGISTGAAKAGDDGGRRCGEDEEEGDDDGEDDDDDEDD